MKLHLIAAGAKMPAWVEQGYAEYARRMPPSCSLHLTEIPTMFRGKNLDLERTLKAEGRKMLDAVPRGSKLVTLEVDGRALSTEMLAAELEGWMQGGRDVALLVGGPEGLSPECSLASELKWSLSKLTLPHPLVRVVLAEALYRAWSVMTHHPYHRA